MTAKRLYFILIGIVCLLLAGLLGGAYGINSLLSGRSDKLVSLKAKSQALTQEQLSLAGAKQSIQKYSGLEQIAQSVVPEDKDQAEAVREIVNLAAANGVSLASITFPASTLGTSTTGTSGATSSTPKVATPTIVHPDAAGSALSQLTPVSNIPGVYLLSITVDSDPNAPVAYSAFINFLSALEHDRRTAQVSTITLEPDTSNRNLLTFSLVLNEYIKP